jgi:4-amino-4-deoxy-L-arabinose transferase-like glycosyltransferase
MLQCGRLASRARSLVRPLPQDFAGSCYADAEMPPSDQVCDTNLRQRTAIMQPLPADTGQLNKSGRVLLVAVFVIAALLRVYGICDRGVLLWDEGSYLMEGRFIATGVKAAAWQLAGKLPWITAPESEQLREMVAGIAPGIMGKPGHAGLVALFMLIFGDHLYTPALLSIVCSLVIMYLVYRLGLVYLGPVGATVAVYVLAISPYYLFYSRVGLAEMDFALGGLLVVWLLWRHLESAELLSKRAAVGLGVLVGVSFLLNYRVYIVLALALFWLGVILMRRGASPTVTVSRVAYLGVGFVIPLLAVEGLYHLGAGIAQTVQPGMELRTYFEQLLWLATAHGGEPLTLANVPTYAYLLMRWEWPVLVLLVIGTVVAARRQRMVDWLVLSFFWLPLLQWSLRADGYARLAVLNLPLYALLAGLGFQTLLPARLGGTQRALIGAALIILIGAAAAYADLPILQAKSLHGRALAVTVEGGSAQIIDTNPGVGVVHEEMYRLEDNIRLPELPHEALKTLRQAREQGAKYLITDMQRFVSGTRLMSLSRYRHSACHAIETRCRPIWEAPHMQGLFFHYCFEHNWGFRQTLQLYDAYRESSDFIRIYRLDDAIAALDEAAEEGY